MMRRIRTELTAHVGGAPSATQRVLIDRAAQLALRLALLDEKMLTPGGAMTEHGSRQYLAWSNALDRAMRTLGLKGAAQRQPSLADVIRQSRAA